MYLNDIDYPQNPRGLTSEQFNVLRPTLQNLRASGEIHIESHDRTLTLEVLQPHRGINGPEITEEEMVRRGFSKPIAFLNLAKIAFGKDRVILYPARKAGVRYGRKRTLRYRDGWISTSRVFFNAFRIIEVSHAEYRPASKKHLLELPLTGITPCSINTPPNTPRFL